MLLELCSPDGWEMELMVVPNLNEGRDREVGEDLNNEVVGGMIVIEVCSLLSWKIELNDRIQSRPTT